MSEITPLADQPTPTEKPAGWARTAYMAGQIDHQTYYLGLADIIGRAAVEALARRAIGSYDVAAELARDKHLNTIPLHRWDACHTAMVALIAAGKGAAVNHYSWSGAPPKPGTFCWSLSDTGCVLKAVAKTLAGEPVL